MNIFDIWAKAVALFMLVCGYRDDKPKAFKDGLML